jgi:hypothetical protein
MSKTQLGVIQMKLVSMKLNNGVRWLFISLVMLVGFGILISPVGATATMELFSPAVGDQAGGSTDYFVRDYGAVGDGITSDKAAIQRAIDDAAANGGGDVVFDQSKAYVTGNLHLKSGVSLRIETGSTILASKYWWDYDHNDCSDDDHGTCVCGRMAPLLFADKEQDIVRYGGGTIQGRKGIWGSEDARCDFSSCSQGGPALLFLSDVSHATIRDVTIKDNGDAAVILAESDHILIENVNIHTPTKVQCNDALDIFGSQHVTVRNNDIESGDDAVALKAQSNVYCASHMMTDIDPGNLEPVDDIIVENNRIYAPSGGHALKIGWELNGECSNVIWRDNIFRTGTRAPIGIVVTGPIEGQTSVHHVYYENNRHETGELVQDLEMNYSHFNCEYYEIYWNGTMPNRYVQTADECGGSLCTRMDWQDQGCGLGTCSSGEMYQTRNCYPPGCDSETRCVAHATCLDGFIDEDINQDGLVDQEDLQLCVKVVLADEQDQAFVERSDQNDDGRVNTVDVIAIVNALLQE